MTTAANDLALGRRFPLLWGMLTVSYGLAIAYRAVAQSIIPGLPTFAAISAILAVWLGFYDFVRSRRSLQAAVALTILATVLLNTASVIRAALDGRRMPGEQIFFTIILAYVLAGKLHELQAHRRDARAHLHEH